MRNTSPTIRLMVACCLIVSLTIAGVSPVLMRAANASESVGAGDASVTRCCCGTMGGKCCGMACCGVDAPKPQRTSGPQKDCNQLGGLFWLICQKQAGFSVDCVPEGFCVRHSSILTAGCRLTTLHALQVLLQT